MLKPVYAMTNGERQRLFRERNPGYYGRLHAKRNAAAIEGAKKLQAIAQILSVKREPLMLPAPVEVIVIPGLTTIGAIPAREEVALQVADLNAVESHERSASRGR